MHVDGDLHLFVLNLFGVLMCEELLISVLEREGICDVQCLVAEATKFI